MKRLLLALAAGALLLGACGDDGDGGSAGSADLNAEEQAMADKISASLLEDNDEDFPIDQAQADCVGNGMVAELGTEKLEVIDFEADDVEFALSESDADKAAEVFVSCVDMGDALAAGFAEGGEISEESADCLADKFDDDTMKRLFSQTFQGQDIEDSGEFLRLVTEGMAECLTDEEMESVTG